MPDLKRILEEKIDRRESAKKPRALSWSALSLFGMVGFVVCVPVAAMTYVGALFKPAWATLACILAGVALGLYNAYRWVRREIG